MVSVEFSPYHSSVRCSLEAEVLLEALSCKFLWGLSALLLLLGAGGGFSFGEVYSWMSLIDNCAVKTEVLK